jgi:hypothetical protein
MRWGAEDPPDTGAAPTGTTILSTILKFEAFG